MNASQQIQQGRPGRLRKWLSFVLIWAIVAMSSLAGCEMEEVVVRDGWANLKEMADKKPDSANESQTRRESRFGYSIPIASFTGPDRYDQANQLIQQLMEQEGVPDLWAAEVNYYSTVYCGQYKKYEDPQAKKNLEKLRTVNIDGNRPFEHAEILPLTGNEKKAEKIDPYDLKPYVGFFSLQVGYYDDNFGPDFRKAAEEAVRILRAEGDEAYYYHGPLHSLITIGLFTRDDFVQVGNTEVYGPRMKELQKKYPHNIGNGHILIEKIHGEKVREQPSFLVRVF